MITEDYVSFETAKLFKEKGFDEVCFRYAESKEIYESGDWYVGNVTGGCIGVPTLQMAMKWLREVHNIHFVVEPFTHDSNKIYYGVNVLDKDLVTVIYENLEDNTYEKACEAAIYYCVKNLI